MKKLLILVALVLFSVGQVSAQTLADSVYTEYCECLGESVDSYKSDYCHMFIQYEQKIGSKYFSLFVEGEKRAFLDNTTTGMPLYMKIANFYAMYNKEDIPRVFGLNPSDIRWVSKTHKRLKGIVEQEVDGLVMAVRFVGTTNSRGNSYYEQNGCKISVVKLNEGHEAITFYGHEGKKYTINHNLSFTVDDGRVHNNLQEVNKILKEIRHLLGLL